MEEEYWEVQEKLFPPVLEQEMKEPEGWSPPMYWPERVFAVLEVLRIMFPPERETLEEL
jgi:hypothetical protein